LQRGSAAGAPVKPNSPLESVERDPEKVTPPIVPEGAHAGHYLSLRVNLNAGTTLGDIRSVAHPLVIQRQGMNRAVITLKDGATLPNKDLILRYQAGGSSVETGLLAHTTERGGYFSLIFQPPLKPKAAQIAQREMVYVIDQTGSQTGFPIEKSKETIRAALAQLRPDDTFNLIGFNTDVYPCFPKPVAASQANIQEALKYLAGINAGGGTDILKSMDFVLRQPADPARLRVVAYFTDGFVGNDMQIIDEIRKHRGTTRIFPFGIGNSVNRFLIEQMAREGRGLAQVVTLESQGQKAADKFVKCLQRPLLLNPQVTFGDLPVSEVFPKVLPDLYAEGPLVIHGRYSKPVHGFITVSGVFQGKPWHQRVPVNLPAKTSANPALPSLWARAKIEDYQSRDWLGAQNGNPDPKIKGFIVQTALDYQLMSQYTSFVAVEQRVVNKGGQNKTMDVPVEMPEGVSHAGIFGERRRKAAYALSAGAPMSARPGDPLILVQAPRDAAQVIALLPGGEIKRLEWNEERQAWQCRFDIPGYVAAGEHNVTVIIVRQDGTRQRLTLTFKVDVLAPQGSALIAADGDHWRLHLKGDGDIDHVDVLLPWRGYCWSEVGKSFPDWFRFRKRGAGRPRRRNSY
jgi:Ca-activated chloride channel family protein